MLIACKMPSLAPDLKVKAERGRSLRLSLYIRDLSTKNFENRLPFELVLQCWVNTHFKGFVELSSLLLNVERFSF